MDDKKIPPCPYNGNPNPFYISWPSGLMVQDPLLRNGQEILDDLRFASMRTPTPTPRLASPSPPRQSPKKKAKKTAATTGGKNKEKKKLPTTECTPEVLNALRDEYRTNWDHDWDRRTRDTKRAEIAGRVGVTRRIVGVKFGEFHRQVKKGSALFSDA